MLARRQDGLLLLVVALLGCGQEPETSRGVALEETLGSDMVPVSEETVKVSGGPAAWASGAPTVLFVNFDGGTITKTDYTSDSTTNQSFIGGGTIPPFNGDAAARASVISYLKALYADFNLKIVTTRPASGDYDMAMVGGWPSSIGLPNGPSGVAPVDCGHKLPRDVSFTFSEVIRSMLQCSTGSPLYHRNVAETIAHEAGHTYGLPHSNDGCDLMSYSSCAQPKKFLDETMAMQADSMGLCGLSSMNSHAILLAALGPAPAVAPKDTTPPMVTILSPASGAQLGGAVVVSATVSDDTGVVRVEAREGSKVLDLRTAAPFEFSLPLAPGEHTVTVHGFDAAGNAGTASVSFRVGGATLPPSPDGGPPSGSDLGGAPAPGSFGAACASPAECQSHLCARAAGGAGFCTETCDEQTRLCPSGATCQIATGGFAVCGQPAWALDRMTGGCNLGDGSLTRPPLCSLALLLLLGIARRRA